MAERKELLRDLESVKTKMAEIDKAISVAEGADETTEALDTEFSAFDKQRKTLLRAISRKEALDEDTKSRKAAKSEDDDDDDKDADDDKDDDDDKDEDKSKKGKKSLQAPSIIRNGMRRLKLSPIQAAGAYFWGKAAAKMHGARHAHDQIIKVWGDEAVAKAAVGAMDTTIPTIVQDASQVVIHILSTKSIVRAAGARIEDMARGNKTIFRQNVGAQAFYFGEGQTSTVSKVGFDHIDLSWHKMGALVYLTKEEMMFPSINTGEYVVNEITRRIALREDKTFLMSPAVSTGGPGTEPQGIPAYTASANLINSTTIASNVNWQSIANDLASLESLLSGHMVEGPYAIFCNMNVVTFLKAVTNGFTFPFRSELSQPQPTLNGHPVYTSQQLPTVPNTGSYGTPTWGTTSVTPIYMVKPQHLIVADAYQYDVQMSDQGSFNDGGTQVNLWGEQKVAFLATSAIDFAQEHDVSSAILTATNWTTAAGAIQPADRYTQAASTTTSTASSVLQPTTATDE